MVGISAAEVSPNTEIRKLDGYIITGLCQLLDPDGDWEKLMHEIRRDIFNLNDDERKYTYEDIRAVREAGERRGSCTEIFFNEWGTSGRKRPTLQLLYDYLKKIDLLKAANYIGVYLNLPPISYPIFLPEKLPYFPPEIIPNIPPEVPESSVSLPHKPRKKQGIYILSQNEKIEEPPTIPQQDVQTVRKIDSTVIEGGNEPLISHEYLSNLDARIVDHVERFPYNELKICTQNFDESCKLGSGAFGSVYLGLLNGENRAIKILENCAEKQFERELSILGKISHERLLSPIAVSIDQFLCLIYPYMSHGSLEDRLALKRKELLPLEWQKRIMIARNIIEGLRYLHTRPEPIVHRDIKTSNILLDEADVAKIGDFGLIREDSPVEVSNVEGTTAYMAPEGQKYQCSPKLDVYSYGMVLLELLTGLPIMDEEEGHLKYFIEEALEDEKHKRTILDFVDKKAGKWVPEIVNELYLLSENCLIFESKERIDSAEAEKRVIDLVNKIQSR